MRRAAIAALHYHGPAGCACAVSRAHRPGWRTDGNRVSTGRYARTGVPREIATLCCRGAVPQVSWLPSRVPDRLHCVMRRLLALAACLLLPACRHDALPSQVTIEEVVAELAPPVREGAIVRGASP